MRSYGRIFFENGTYQWVEVDTAPSGDNSAIWLLTLIQCLLLNLGESPFWASHGIPAHPSVVQQVFPDFYVYRTQQQFSSYFASLVISKEPNPAEPTYLVNVTTFTGAKLAATIPI